MIIKIKSWITNEVLFAWDCKNNTIKLTVEAAVKAGARLDRARLDGARLVGANLDGARLDRAHLAYASLDGARLDRARLDGGHLVGASLDGASLDGAHLAYASLDGASLVGASLDGASLDGARLVGASLDGASLVGASLDGASLDGAEKLIGKRPIIQIGPLGSRCAYLVGYLTDHGVRIRAGCFFGSLAEFENAVKNKHGDNIHAAEYGAAIALIKAHAELWAEKTTQA